MTEKKPSEIIMKIALVLLWFFNVIALAIGSEDASDPLRKGNILQF